MDEDDRTLYEYGWINGIKGHMHVITSGVDMHLALDDRRTVQEGFQRPDPTNGWRGVIRTTEELPARADVSGLYAISMMSPFDEFLVVDYAGAYQGRLQRGRDGLYSAYPLDRPVPEGNQRFQTVPEALKYVSEARNRATEGEEE